VKKVILYIASSLDGYIAKTDGSVDWLDHNVELGEYKIDSFLTGVDSILIGRKTYVQSLGFGDWYFKNQDTYVFSKSGVAINSPRTQLVDGDLIAFVKNLKSTPGKDIWLLGGGEINRQLLEHDLIEEIMLFIQPTCLGAGIRLFGDRALDEFKHFMLEKTVPFANSSILLHYKRRDHSQV
jgi:dihydrofolate reductase